MFRFATLKAVAALAAAIAQAGYRLTILHANDFRSRFEPVNA